jgi:predicted small lipoprotein YifL
VRASSFPLPLLMASVLSLAGCGSGDILAFSTVQVAEVDELSISEARSSCANVRRGG